MSRHAKTKPELFDSIHESRAKLEKKFSTLTTAQMVWPGSMDDWSVKDILAHLVDWEQRCINWYKAGLRGEVPEIPAPGMTWRDLNKINQIGYENQKDETLEEVMEQFQASYQEILDLIDGMSEEEIFTPGFYAWTGDSNLLSFLNANTASHYDWATRNIRTTVIRNGCV